MENKASLIPFPSSSEDITVITQSGARINPDDDVWVLDKDITIHLEFLSDFDADTADFFRKTLIERARILMPHTVSNEVHWARSYSKVASSLTRKGFLEFSEKNKNLARSPTNNFKALILFGVDFGFSGAPEDLVDLLRETYFGAPKKPEIKPVVTKDPINGPFSDIELGNVIAESLTSYIDGNMSLESYSALMFFAETGRRRIQCSDLKIKDLFSKEADKDITNYYINVPRRKQVNQTFRDRFKHVPISEDLWIVLNLQAASVKEQVKSVLSVDGEQLPDDLPLFLNKSKLSSILSLEQLLEMVKGDFLHKNSEAIGRLIKTGSNSFNIVSERTGERLQIKSHRFRHTIGNNAAREGYGYRVIAEILDHTTDVVAIDYVKNSSEIVDRLDRAMALQLAPLAQAFVGTIIKDEKEAERGDDPSSRIRNQDGDYGSCGSYGFCSASAPVACYTCRSFQPWLDAPHELILNHLLRERDRLKDVTGDMRMASVNDRLILAVADVVQRCELEKTKRLQ